MRLIDHADYLKGGCDRQQVTYPPSTLLRSFHLKEP